MSKDKKYPWIKRIFKKDEPAKCVYAGPEKLPNGRPRIVGPDGDDVNPASGVYAGPEAFGISMGRVYAGPRPADSDGDTDMNDVYAGPEFFESDGGDPEDAQDEPQIEPQDEPIPNDASENAEAPELPKDLPPFPPDEMFMCVYAGPEFFNKDPNAPPAGVFVPPADDPSPRLRICPNCKRDVPETSKFCPECGAAFADEDVAKDIPEDSRLCEACGAIYPREMKFCPECGTLTPRDGGEN